jgi:hypothetical protein
VGVLCYRRDWCLSQNIWHTFLLGLNARNCEKLSLNVFGQGVCKLATSTVSARCTVTSVSRTATLLGFSCVSRMVHHPKQLSNLASYCVLVWVVVFFYESMKEAT